jgi:hypothetical protein
MLASITPLGERGRQTKWSITVAAFLLGASAAGVVSGAFGGWLGSVAVPSAVGAQERLAVLAVAALLALGLDIGPVRVPGPRRQVDERWLDRYRGWVYGLGYGAQMGVGVATIVSSAATYVALLAALLSGSPAAGALVGGVYGAVRGATPLWTAHVQRPDQLIALHSRLERWQAPATRVGWGALAAILALAAAGTLT